MSACAGDSGGPGVINGELAGIINKADPFCRTDWGTGYIKVYNYRDWIIKNTGLDM